MMIIVQTWSKSTKKDIALKLPNLNQKNTLKKPEQRWVIVLSSENKILVRTILKKIKIVEKYAINRV